MMLFHALNTVYRYRSRVTPDRKMLHSGRFEIVLCFIRLFVLYQLALSS